MDTKPDNIEYWSYVVCARHTVAVPGAGRSSFALLSSVMDACSCSITKSSSKKKSLDKVSCRNSTRSSMDSFIRCSVNRTHRNKTYTVFESWAAAGSHMCGLNSLTLVQFEDGVGHGGQQSFTLQDVDVPDPEGEGERSLDTNRTVTRSSYCFLCARLVD